MELLVYISMQDEILDILLLISVHVTIICYNSLHYNAQILAIILFHLVSIRLA